MATSVDLARGQPSRRVDANGHLGVGEADEKTDYSRWRLLDERGRHTWRYLTSEEEVQKWPQSIADKHHLGLPTVRHRLRKTAELTGSGLAHLTQSYQTF